VTLRWIEADKAMVDKNAQLSVQSTSELKRRRTRMTEGAVVCERVADHGTAGARARRCGLSGSGFTSTLTLKPVCRTADYHPQPFGRADPKPEPGVPGKVGYPRRADCPSAAKADAGLI
jgi:hypothetical protein